MKNLVHFLSLIAVLLGTAGLGAAEVINPPEYGRVTYMSGDRMFYGYIFRPEGKGPYPTVLWNHGHRGKVDMVGIKEYAGIAKAFTSGGYAVFLPDRHTIDIRENEYSTEMQNLLINSSDDAEIKQKQYVELVRINEQDILAALRWLQGQAWVDTNRVVMAGWSSGAHQSLLVCNQNLGVRAYLAFSPAAMTWSSTPWIQGALQSSVRDTQAPIFIIQTTNDKSLQPVKVLGEILSRKSPVHRTKIYPAIGSNDSQQNSFCILGWESWGYDVISWLDDTMPTEASLPATAGSPPNTNTGGIFSN